METISTILIAAFTILLGIIGYYIVRENNRQDERHKEQKATNQQLFGMIGNFNNSLNELNKTLVTIQERQEAHEVRFNEHKDVCKYKYAEK
jgi:hypothetical protein